MGNDNSGLLIAALVAIVAVVGLVILFKGGSSGSSISDDSFLCPPGQKATVSLDTSSLICVRKDLAAQRHVAFDSPIGKAGQWKKFDYPGVEN